MPDAEKDAWPFGAEAACRLIAAVSWPNERQEHRDRWAVAMLHRPYLLATEVERARERLEAAIACVIPPGSGDTDGPTTAGTESEPR